MSTPRSILAPVVCLLLALPLGRASARQLPSPPVPAGPDRPAVLRTYVEPAYPDSGRQHGIGGTVLLRLGVDQEGNVTEAIVEQGLGGEFDSAAVAAARRLVFAPALTGGHPVASRVRFEYRFEPPGHTHTVPVAPPTESTGHAAPLMSPPEESEVVQVYENVETERPLTAASARTVRDRDLKLRVLNRPSDLLAVTPGLMLVQHAGGGKASQYLLRGFDADHGTDVAFSLDGIPVNMVSHGHGQGYSDTNFIIPELVERVEVSKGPYFVDSGDFANAGSVELSTRSSGESFLSLAGGSFHTGRAVAVAAPNLAGPLHPLLATELVHTDGPFQNPERFDKQSFYGKLSYDLGPRSSVALAASSYSGNWNASGQIPERAVKAGLVGFFGALDPSEGGASSRQNLSVSCRLRPTPQSEFLGLAYLSFYDFTLYSNFTFFSRDPINGDQIEQRDSRILSGARASYRFLRQWRGILFDSLVGGSARADSIDNGLSHDRARERLAPVVDAHVQESSVSMYAKEEVQLFPWLRLVGGLRADHFSFRVDDHLEDLAHPDNATSGVRGATVLSPKATLVLSPLHDLDLFLNYGQGFHSNDARGVVLAHGAVTPLTRTRGYEVGARTRLLADRLNLSLALWRLDIDSETVWMGDEGTTEPSGATRRIGADFEGRMQIRPWLFADLDLTTADARFRDNAGNGQAVALAPRLTISAGLSVLHPRGLRGALRLLHIAERPATQDGFLRAEATTLLDLFAAWRWRSLELGVSVENLLDRRYKSAQFATVTRLPGEPPTTAPPPANACPAGTRASTSETTGNFAGCQDLSFSPGPPLAVRVTGTYYF